MLEALRPLQIEPRPAANGSMHYFDIHQMMYDPVRPESGFPSAGRVSRSNDWFHK